MALNPENRIPITAGTNEIFFDRNTGKISYKNNLGIVTPLEGYNITNIFQSAEDGLNFNFKEGSIGPKVSFKKLSGSNPETNKDVIIPGLLEITRGNEGGGIYNIAKESSFNNSVSPQGTVWSTQYLDPENTSWAPLWDIENRTFDTWNEAAKTPSNSYAAPQYVGMPAVMRFANEKPSTVRYYLIMFTEWGVGQYGQEGAFAYDRWEISPQVNFEKIDYDNTAVDIVSEGVHIKRNNNGPLYNAVTEDSSAPGVSPTNTKWNSIYTDIRPGYSGWDDLSNLESRVYTDFTNALDYNVGANILGTFLIMWDLTTNLYYRVQFFNWTQNNAGGGFSYRRIVIPQSCGVEFADGTVLNTAKGLGASGVQSVTGLDTDNTDPLNPVVQIAVDGITVTGDGKSGTPLSAVFQSPSVDGVTITGDGTLGNPLVAAGGGGGAVNYSNVFFVDGINGNNGTGLQNDFTKPYLTLVTTYVAAIATAPTATNRALVYVRRGEYTADTFLVLSNYVDVYCEPGVVFVGMAIIDGNSSIEAKWLGKASFTGTISSSNELFRLTGVTSKVYFEFDNLFSSRAAFGIFNGASATIVGRKVFAETFNTSYGCTFRGSGTITLNITEEIAAWHDVLSPRAFSGKLYVTCPRIYLHEGNYTGGDFKHCIIMRDNLGGEAIINGDLIVNPLAGYYAGISGVIGRWTDSFGTIRLNGNIYAENQFGVYGLGSSGASRTIINGDVRSNNLCAYIASNSNVVFRNGTLMNWNNLVGVSEGYPVFSIGGSGKVWVENCHMYSLGTGATQPLIAGVWKDTTTSQLCINNTVHSGSDAIGFFVRNSAAGQPVNNVRIMNSRSTNPLDTNITDLLSPTGFVQDPNIIAIGFI